MIAILMAGAPGAQAAAKPHSQSSSQAIQAVKNLEQHWLEHEDDPAALEQILAPDFVHALPFGFITKAEQIEYLKKHPQTKAVSKHFEQLQVRMYGEVAIANGIVSETADGKTRRTVFTDVFVLRQGKWRAVNAQESPMMAPPGQAK